MSAAFERLHPAIQHHVVNSLQWKSLRALQEASIDAVLDGEHTLILAPTAGGKTEAAFFPLLSRMLTEDWRGLGFIWLCPIKALLNNLVERLEAYARLVGRRVELWHGDVSDSKRRRIGIDPPDVLLTTPESLEVMLVSTRHEPARMFDGLHAVVVDELHAFAGDDRGWHLLSVVERAQRIAGREIQRVGLSATIGNPDDLLGWLAGSARGNRRVVFAPPTEGIPVDLGIDHVATIENAALVISRLHRGEKRLVFCDSRMRVEAIASELRGRGVNTFVSHSSLSVDERRQAEAAFATARDCVIVATSTLELGLDVGDLDRIIQIDAPYTVSSFLQRLGRTGRRAGTRRNCLFLTTDDAGLLRAAAVTRLWKDGFVEPLVPPPLPLHVFAQQIMALCLQIAGMSRSGWHSWIGGVAGFATVASEADAIIDHMLSRKILVEESGCMRVGPEGERLFGRRHFMDLYSVFSSPPLVVVAHGRTPIGQVHEFTFQGHSSKSIVLSLGGRAWLVTSVDWNRRIAQVEPTTGRGTSRWVGEGLPLHFRLCRGIRAVLAGAEVPATLSQRATARLAELMDEFAFVDETGTFFVRAGPDSLSWWTFAGARANATLAANLHSLVDVQTSHDNLRIHLLPSLRSDALPLALAATPRDPSLLERPQLDPKVVSSLKFNECLPPELAARLLLDRTHDAAALRAVLSEPVLGVSRAQ